MDPAGCYTFYSELSSIEKLTALQMNAKVASIQVCTLVIAAGCYIVSICSCDNGKVS